MNAGLATKPREVRETEIGVLLGQLHEIAAEIRTEFLGLQEDIDAILRPAVPEPPTIPGPTGPRAAPLAIRLSDVLDTLTRARDEIRDTHRRLEL